MSDHVLAVDAFEGRFWVARASVQGEFVIEPVKSEGESGLSGALSSFSGPIFATEDVVSDLNRSGIKPAKVLPRSVAIRHGIIDLPAAEPALVFSVGRKKSWASLVPAGLDDEVARVLSSEPLSLESMISRYLEASGQLLRYLQALPGKRADVVEACVQIVETGKQAKVGPAFVRSLRFGGEVGGDVIRFLGNIDPQKRVVVVLADFAAGNCDLAEQLSQGSLSVHTPELTEAFQLAVRGLARYGRKSLEAKPAATPESRPEARSPAIREPASGTRTTRGHAPMSAPVLSPSLVAVAPAKPAGSSNHGRPEPAAGSSGPSLEATSAPPATEIAKRESAKRAPAFLPTRSTQQAVKRTKWVPAGFVVLGALLFGLLPWLPRPTGKPEPTPGREPGSPPTNPPETTPPRPPPSIVSTLPRPPSETGSPRPRPCRGATCQPTASAESVKLHGSIRLRAVRGARVTLDNSSLGLVGPEGELVVPEVSTGPHHVRVQTADQDVTRTATVVSGRETLLEFPGLLKLVVSPWADVKVDGAPAGITPLGRLTLESGVHTVAFSHPEYGTLQREVTVHSGQVTTLEVNLAARPSPVTKGVLQLKVNPWAEVTIDGVSAGITPLGSLTLGDGDHTVVLSHPDYKTIQQIITVRSGEITKLEVDLTLDRRRR